MPALLPNVDPDGLLEFSVVYTDRALNHMSQRFQGVMRDVHQTLVSVYGADAAVIVPGSGSFGMESVARQFASGKKVLIIRNGWFSYRWSQILSMGAMAAQEVVLKARRSHSGEQAPWIPCPIEEVEAAIARERPDVVFAPHVETAAGMMLPQTYIARLAAAVHAVGGLLVLDCIAAGAMWLDMRATGVDVLISAPQKGWSSSPGCAMVMLSARALQALEQTSSTSFAMDLKRWQGIMRSYLQGGHSYHATLPTDALLRLRDTMAETAEFGFDAARAAQIELGRQVRALLAAHGYPSVAAAEFAAPGVVVSYTRNAQLQNASRFAQLGLQTAAGVALQCDEGDSFQTFRIGLFGLDKWRNIARTVDALRQALEQIASDT